MGKILRAILGGNDWAITGAELKSLLVPFAKLKIEQKSERRAILMKILLGVLGLFLWFYGIFIALVLLIISVTPPLYFGSYLLLVFSLIYFVALFPAFGGKAMKTLGVKVNAILRGGLFLFAAIYVIPYALSDIEVTKKKMTEEAERAAVESMTPEQQYQHREDQRRKEYLVENAKQREIREAEDARLKAESDAERKKMELREKESSAKEAAEEKRNMKEHNNEQREFYGSIGSPKMLYKCKNSEIEKAIGAKIGNINLLIDGAQKDCGSSGYEVIKKNE